MSDVILPFQLEVSSVRGRIGRLSQTVNDLLSAHTYPEVVGALVAEMAVISALVGQMIKLKWRLSIQVRAENDSPVSLVFADYIAPHTESELPKIRAYAVYDAEAVFDKSRAVPFDLLDTNGTFALSIDQGPGLQPYQGMTPVAGNSLSECVQVYFAQSEQIATRILTHLEHREGGWTAGGLLLQHMPTSDDQGGRSGRAEHPDGLMRAYDIARINGYEEDWQRVNILLDTLGQSELLDDQVSSESILTRLFHEERVRAFDPQSIAFGCTCARNKIEAALNLEKLADENGEVHAKCQFCGKEYMFQTKDDIS